MARAASLLYVDIGSALRLRSPRAVGSCSLKLVENPTVHTNSRPSTGMDRSPAISPVAAPRATSIDNTARVRTILAAAESRGKVKVQLRCNAASETASQDRY